MVSIPGTSYATVSMAQNALRTLSAPSGASAQGKKLVDGVVGDPYAQRRASVSLNDAKAMLRIAVVSGETILKSLEYMLKSVKLADHESLVSPLTSLINSEGSRVSRLVIQVAIERTVAAIDNLASQVGGSTANILSSKSFELAIQTTGYGGTVSIAPQAMDVAALDIENLYLLNQSGITDATARIGKAIEIAQIRVLNLQNLQTTLSSPNTLASALSKFGAGSTGRLGAFVDLLA